MMLITIRPIRQFAGDGHHIGYVIQPTHICLFFVQSRQLLNLRISTVFLHRFFPADCGHIPDRLTSSREVDTWPCVKA
jgi:hypothetical protein